MIKFEARNPKHETKSKFKIRMFSYSVQIMFEFCAFEFSSFVSSFEIRISCFINLTALHVSCAEKD